MAKYHLSKDGTVGLCRATRACPLGGDVPHGEFGSHEEAVAWAETKLAEKYGPVKTVHKELAGERAFEGSETIIPHAVENLENMSVNSGDLNKNDILYNEAGEELGIITSVARGRVNATVEYGQNGKIKKKTLPLGGPQVNIARRVETPASVKAREEAWNEAYNERLVKKFKPSRNQVLAELSANAEKGYALSGFDISKLVEADAKDQVFKGYESFVAGVKKEQEEKGEVNLPYTTAFNLYKERLSREIIADASSANSVSTSEGHNVHSRALLEAKAKFIDGRWYM